MSLALQALRLVERGEICCLPPDAVGSIFYFDGRDPYELAGAPIGSEHHSLNRIFSELEFAGRIRPVGHRLADGGLRLALTDDGRVLLEEA